MAINWALGRRMWVVAVVLLAVGGLGAYQFVFGQGDLESLCSVLVEIVVPEKGAVVPAKVVPPHVQKYQNAAQAAASRVAPIDEVNEQLDLRGVRIPAKLMDPLLQRLPDKLSTPLANLRAADELEQAGAAG
jgi:hypothetical protein